MKPLRVLPEAEEELVAAAAWYEARRDGLGVRLVSAVDGALTRVHESPQSFPIWRSTLPYRKCALFSFPFVIFFRAEPHEVVVVAIAHGKREPGYWARRDAP